jgi:hypothetical protein
MATAAPTQSLPLFYHGIEPLNATQHGKMHVRPIEKSPTIGRTHAIPLTVDEFGLAQRHYPIVFSIGENPVPLALMGLNEGVNVFVDDEGRFLEQFYLPAYVRRYPFLLARLDPNSETMSLCFDPTSGLVHEDGDGAPLFDGEEPAQVTKDLLQFCQNFEEAGMRTQQFVQELKQADLLMDGEVAITRPDDPEKPYIYRGFQMVNQEKLQELRGDKLRSWNQSGLLPLIYAHLYSLDLMRMVFGRQADQGKIPALVAAT